MTTTVAQICVHSDLHGRHMSTPDYTRWDSFEVRYWGRVEKTSDCWNWTGKLTHKGYGRRIGLDRREVYPHRLAYEMAHGPIPDGLVIDHLCRNRRCVNPDHLEPVTAEENTRRGTEARWSEPCPNGHPAEVYRHTIPSGKNVCRKCRSDSEKRHDLANRDELRARARARYAARKEAGEIS